MSIVSRIVTLTAFNTNIRNVENEILNFSELVANTAFK